MQSINEARRALRIRRYNVSNPLILYQSEPRRQRTISQRLGDAICDCIEFELGDMEYAILADASPSKFLLIVNLSRELFDPNEKSLDTITCNNCAYRVIGHILDNQPEFYPKKKAPSKCHSKAQLKKMVVEDVETEHEDLNQVCPSHVMSIVTCVCKSYN